MVFPRTADPVPVLAQRAESESSLDDKLETPGASIAPLNDAFAYTASEERATRRKLDLVVMPLLFLGFYVFQLERGNISNALTDGFLRDVGITQDQFNTGQSLLYLGIILLEIPSNWCLQIVGPQIWISFQVLAFGLVATLQAFQKGYGGYLATRIMLGVTECGYIPGSLYVISTFYKREELAARNSVFFLGSGLASATSGLLAYALLPLGDKHPQLHGWQWLMIIEGSMAIFISFIFILLLPGSPAKPSPIFFPKLSIFTERQRQILTARVYADDAAKKNSANRLSPRKDILGTLGNWRVWPHVLIAIALIAPTGAMGTYTPTLIQGFKFSKLTANALSSVAGWISLVVTFAFGYTSDKLRIRGPLVIIAIGVFWVFWVAFQQNSLSSDRWRKYGLLIMVQGFNAAYHPLNATWLSLNCKTPQQRSVAMAMFVMAANSGALIGSQLLRGDDNPLYRRGFKVCVAFASLGLATAIGQHIQYRVSNRRLDRHAELVRSDSEKETAAVHHRFTI